MIQWREIGILAKTNRFMKLSLCQATDFSCCDHSSLSTECNQNSSPRKQKPVPQGLLRKHHAAFIKSASCAGTIRISRQCLTSRTSRSTMFRETRHKTIKSVSCHNIVVAWGVVRGEGDTKQNSRLNWSTRMIICMNRTIVFATTQATCERGPPSNKYHSRQTIFCDDRDRYHHPPASTKRNKIPKRNHCKKNEWM